MFFTVTVYPSTFLVRGSVMLRVYIRLYFACRHVWAKWSSSTHCSRRSVRPFKTMNQIFFIKLLFWRKMKVTKIYAKNKFLKCLNHPPQFSRESGEETFSMLFLGPCLINPVDIVEIPLFFFFKFPISLSHCAPRWANCEIDQNCDLNVARMWPVFNQLKHKTITDL